MKKRICFLLSMIIILCAIYPIVPVDQGRGFCVTAQAQTLTSGECGVSDNTVFWTYEPASGLLTISGNGAMKDFMSHGPWWERDSGIKTVSINGCVTSIGKNAFTMCDKMTTVTIPESVTSIGSRAFWMCEDLRSISIPKYVDRIDECVFEGCSKLEEIVVDDENKSYSGEGCAIIDRKTKMLILGCKNTTIPNGVTSLGDYAFSGCISLSSNSIPNTVTSIGDWAFASCKSLTDFEIPKSVTHIGKSAFSNCDRLTSIEIPEGVNRIENGTFSYCSSLSNVKIPASVKSIGISAFSDCISLKTLIIPNGMNIIASNAFSGCNNLTSVTIPKSVTSIAVGAFPRRDRLTIYGVKGSKAESFANDNSIMFEEIDDDSNNNIETDDDNNNDIETDDEKTPNNDLQPVEEVKKDSHKQTPDVIIESPQRPNNNSTQQLADQIDKNGNVYLNEVGTAEPKNTKLNSDGMTYKVTNASKRSPELSVTGIQNPSEKTVLIPATVKLNGVSYKVTAIAKNAYKNNRKLTKVVIGKNIKKIEKDAFKGCKRLTRIEIKSTKLKSSRVNKNCLKGTRKNLVVKVPKIKYSAYKKIFSKCGNKTARIIK